VAKASNAVAPAQHKPLPDDMKAQARITKVRVSQ
jgi:hypothetical protein